MYKGNGTKMMVYNLKRHQKNKKKRKKNREKESLRNMTSEGKTQDTWIYYSG